MENQEAVYKLKHIIEYWRYSKEGDEALRSGIEALEKLQEYQDLEEQGLLVRPPCKVGDGIYRIIQKWTPCTELEFRRVNNGL